MRTLTITLGLLGLQAAAQAPDNSTVQTLARLIESKYVDPGKASDIAEALRGLASQGVYDGYSKAALAHRLTADLREISGDKHLSVKYSPDPIVGFEEADRLPMPDSTQLAQLKREFGASNLGVPTVKVLDGNIGYVDIPFFLPLALTADLYTSVMQFVAHTDALIIDLRSNRGSMSPDAIPYFSSYFFADSVHLNDLHWRHGEETVSFWTSPSVPGMKYVGKPVFILTSGRTFSGGEEFAYNLQQLERAVVVGEPTRGGAHPKWDSQIDDHFTVSIPRGRAVNPVTGANWEGVGVQPQVAVPALQALEKATQMALTYKMGLASEAESAVLERQLASHPMPKLRKRVFHLKGFDQAQSVLLTGNFTFWNPDGVKMTQKNGRWQAEVMVPEGEIRYQFIVDGQWIRDPANPRVDVYGKGSVIRP